MSAQSTLAIHDISVNFGGITALDRVCLTLAAGSIHALIGPNGAGKTTLVSVLSGERKPDAGEVLLNGRNINALTPFRRARLGLIRTYQITALFQNMSVRENLLLSVVARQTPSLSFKQIFCARDVHTHTQEVVALLERFALADKADTVPRALSHGDRRRLEIAMALASGPKVLLLDEPLAGLSSSDAAVLVTMIDASIRGKIPVLLIEHDMDAVFSLSDEITVMVNGNVLESGSPEKIRNSQRVHDAYLSTEDDF